MISRIVRTEAEFEALEREMKAKGLRVSAVSNAGLTGVNQLRVTFLPASLFSDSAADDARP